MSQVNNLIAKERINLGKKAPLEWPLSIYLETSGICNFKCKFCVQSTNKLKKDIMDFELLKKIVEEIETNDIVIPRMSVCGIGENLVNKNFLKMLQYMDERLRNENHKLISAIELVTNGSLLNEELATSIPKYLDRIVISVEGLYSQEYREIAGVEIDFDKFVENLACLYKNKGKCNIYIKIHNKAIKDDKEREKRFFDIFTPISDQRWIENLSDIFPGFESDLIDKNSGKFRWSLDNKDEAKVIEHRVCPQVFKALQIFANGDCTLCCFDWERKNYIGNVKEKTLHEIWNGEKANNIREKHLRFQKDEFEPCKNCFANDSNEIDNIDAEAGEILARMREREKGI